MQSDDDAALGIPGIPSWDSREQIGKINLCGGMCLLILMLTLFVALDRCKWSNGVRSVAKTSWLGLRAGSTQGFRYWTSPKGSVYPVGDAGNRSAQKAAVDEKTANETINPLVRLSTQYKSRFVHCSLGPRERRVDVYLCGTMHVGQGSQDFVKDVVNTIRPDVCVLEVCERRIDSICPPSLDEEKVSTTLAAVMAASLKERSLRTFGMGVLTWIQVRMATLMGNEIGGEMAIAAQEAHRTRSMVVLGDRQFGVTVARAFDRLTAFERVKMVVILMFEVVAVHFVKPFDYIRKSEQDEGFIKREMERFSKWMPSFADVIINERDEYLAQTVMNICHMAQRPVRVVVVVGAGHLLGIKKWLTCGGVSPERIAEISMSSKHPNPTWPGASQLQTVDTSMIFEPQMHQHQHQRQHQQQQQPQPQPQQSSQPLA